MSTKTKRAISRVGSRAQMTLPKDIREKMKVNKGLPELLFFWHSPLLTRKIIIVSLDPPVKIPYEVMTLGRKGAFTIPRRFRNGMGITAGDSVFFSISQDFACDKFTDVILLKKAEIFNGEEYLWEKMITVIDKLMAFSRDISVNKKKILVFTLNKKKMSKTVERKFIDWITTVEELIDEKLLISRDGKILRLLPLRLGTEEDN
jgi:bifunctional DNA-binding transcriptional regulator/antitoxin component of YhaV-PrlF toxin-antitoxin module